MSWRTNAGLSASEGALHKGLGTANNGMQPTALRAAADAEAVGRTAAHRSEVYRSCLESRLQRWGENRMTSVKRKEKEMQNLPNRDKELIALVAAIASNCGPCVQYHIPEARKAGLSDAEIEEAIALADKVRRVPAQRVVDTARALLAREGNVSRAQEGTSTASCCQPSSLRGDA